MRFSTEVEAYLKGEKFSNGLAIPVATGEKKVIFRIPFLEELVKDKYVIHLGFADHIPLLESKLQKNEWLHARLVASSKVCIGIDIDQEAVEEIKRKTSFQEVYALDITKDTFPEGYGSTRWDMMILGEILEHIDNPVYFLAKIKERFSGNLSEVVVTVPNAFSLQNIKGIFKGKEIINTDHRYWFTPFTLAKVGVMAGLKPIEYYYSSNFEVGMRKKILLARFPVLRSGLIMRFGL